MKNATRFALLLFTLGIATLAAQAQQVYRCGKTYSQIPCPNAVTIDANDARTKSQQQQSEKVIQRDKQLAKEMEETRRQEEALALAGNTAAAEKPAKNKSKKSKPRKTDANAEAEVKAKAKPKKKKNPEFFTATNPPAKKNTKEKSQAQQ